MNAQILASDDLLVMSMSDWKIIGLHALCSKLQTAHPIGLQPS